MKIKSSKVIQIGPSIYLAVLETEEKHPWEEEFHFVKWENGVSIVDTDSMPDENNNFQIIWQIDNLPTVENDEIYWETQIISGTRYDLRFFIFSPSYAIENPNFITEYLPK